MLPEVLKSGRCGQQDGVLRVRREEEDAAPYRRTACVVRRVLTRGNLIHRRGPD